MTVWAALGCYVALVAGALALWGLMCRAGKR